DDAAHHLAAPAELRDATPRLGPQMHGRDLTQGDRHSSRAELHRDLLDVGEAVDVAAAAHEVLVLRDLHDAATHVAVRSTHRVGPIAYRHAIALELRRIEVRLVLLDEPTDRRDLGDTVDALQPVTQGPILERAELLEIVVTGGVHEGVFEHPADAGRI